MSEKKNIEREKVKKNKIYARTRSFVASFSFSGREILCVCACVWRKIERKKYSSTQANFLPPKKLL